MPELPTLPHNFWAPTCNAPIKRDMVRGLVGGVPSANGCCLWSKLLLLLLGAAWARPGGLRVNGGKELGLLLLLGAARTFPMAGTGIPPSASGNGGMRPIKWQRMFDISSRTSLVIGYM